VLLALAVVATAGAPAVITIRPGDTLWDLARKHGTAVAALQQLNSLTGNGTIYAGDRLRITSGAPGAPMARKGERRHLVVTGDTLGGLAVRYGVSASSIAAANRLPDSTIARGRRLTIPSAASGPNLAAVPANHPGVRVPDSVRTSVAQNRATLATRSHPSKAQVRQLVAATARRHGVDPSLAVAVAYHESGFQQRVVSGVDAIGVMQVLPSTGRALGRQQGRTFDLLDAQDNITAGVLLLRQLTRSTGSDEAALAGYYQGLGSIKRRGVLPQTIDYQRNIAVLRQRFANG
jgi:soluble lytic murein transglycosylase-like protein